MIFIGIDVSKAKLDCSLLLDVANGKRKSKSVSNSKAGIIGLLAWCAKQELRPADLHAIMDDCMDAGGRAMQERLPKALAPAMNRPHWPCLIPVLSFP